MKEQTNLQTLHDEGNYLRDTYLFHGKQAFDAKYNRSLVYNASFMQSTQDFATSPITSPMESPSTELAEIIALCESVGWSFEKTFFGYLVCFRDDNGTTMEYTKLHSDEFILKHLLAELDNITTPYGCPTP
jgi:hypothetical protein